MQAMPMQRRVKVHFVVNIDCDAITGSALNRRPQIGTVDTDRRCCRSLEALSLARLNCEVKELAGALHSSLKQRRDFEQIC